MRIRQLGMALLGLVFVVPVYAKPVSYQTFNDWVVACDNTGRCEASGASEGATGMLTLVREAGATGAISLRLSTPEAVDKKRLRADKKILQSDWSTWHAEADDGSATLETSDFNTIADVLGQVRHATRLGFGPQAEDTVSLSGLSAALLLIDERQGRLDTPTALLRRGNKPSSNVPDADPLPAIRAAALPKRVLDAAIQKSLITQVRQSQRALLKSEDCNMARGNVGDTAAALDDQHALVLIECWLGAYQSSSLVFKVPFDQPRQAKRLVLDVPLGNKTIGLTRDMVTMGDFEGGVLTHAAKGRGIADCGESASWVWNGQAFVLTQFSFMDSCRGGAPGLWPTVWRSTVVR